MSTRVWNRDTAKSRIDLRLAEVKDVTIKEYVRDTDLTGIARGVAYRVNGVHIYIDILNFREMLSVTDVDGVTAARRALRFLNLHFRAVARILGDVDAVRVDFHNQRLHAVVTKPYGSEVERVHRAIALAQLVSEVLQRTGEGGDDPMPAARVRVGIDSGIALAVNNGRRGHREPLFLGQPANLAAKRAGGGSDPGIYVTDNVRALLGYAKVANADTAPLTAEQQAISAEVAKIETTVDAEVEAWSEDLKKNPIGRFDFSGHTPPMRDLDLDALSPANSRRQDALSLYADIDGFTAYVAANVNDDDKARNVVRVLHVLRSELDCVLVQDFGGLKVRFIGDCIHGLLAEGTAQTTNGLDTMETAALCAGAMRSSFALAQEVLHEAGIECSLGLAIGVEYGPLAISRLGIKGDMVACAIGRGVWESETEQKGCSGKQIGFGTQAKGQSPSWLADWLDANRRLSGVTYDSVVARRDAVKKSSLQRPVTAASTAAASYAFPAQPAAPSKPAGFA